MKFTAVSAPPIWPSWPADSLPLSFSCYSRSFSWAAGRSACPSVYVSDIIGALGGGAAISSHVVLTGGQLQLPQNQQSRLGTLLLSSTASP